MTHIEQLIQDMCPYGVEFKTLGEVAEIDTGNRNRQDAVEDGQYQEKEVLAIFSTILMENMTCISAHIVFI